MARPVDHAQRLAGYGPQTTDPARIVRPGGGLLLLLRPLLRRTLHPRAAGSGSSILPRTPGPAADPAPGRRWLLVGLPALQLPQALRHGFRADVAPALSQDASGTPMICST